MGYRLSFAFLFRNLKRSTYVHNNDNPKMSQDLTDIYEKESQNYIKKLQTDNNNSNVGSDMDIDNTINESNKINENNINPEQNLNNDDMDIESSNKEN